MKLILCFSLIIFLLRGVIIHQVETSNSKETLSSMNKPITIKRSNLKQFPNDAGDSFGETQLNYLISAINKASAIYGADQSSNIKYIKTVMDATFGDQNSQYNVILEDAPLHDFGDATIYCSDGSNYAFIGYGTNLRYPKYTYLVYKLYVIDPDYDYVSNLIARGSGMNEDEGNLVNSVIKQIDGSKNCDCTNAVHISDRLERVLDANWNVACQSTQGIHSYVAISESKWIMARPAACYYFVYAI